MQFDRKLNILMVLETLRKHTNQTTYLSQVKITELTNKDFDVELDRKTVREHLSTLEYISDVGNDKLFPYKIEKNSKGSYALTVNQFDSYEVNFLIDAILASKSLCANDAVDLADKIIKTLSLDEQKIYKNVKNVYKMEPTNRTQCRETLSTVEAIYNAIADNKQIMFLYKTYDLNGNLSTRNNGSYFTVNPYKVVVKKGDYYLLANLVEQDTLTTFRIDFMEDTYGIEIDRRDIHTLPGYENFKITKYLNEHIYFADGEVVNAEIILNESDAVRYVYDWFGKNAKVKQTQNGLVAYLRGDINALYYWCMQYAEHIQVLKPDSLSKRMFDTACSIQLSRLNLLAKTKQKKLNLSRMFDECVNVVISEEIKYSELRINDFWSTLMDLKTDSISYLHRVQFYKIGQLKDSNIEVLKVVSGRYYLMYLLLLAKEIIEFSEESGLDTLPDNGEEKSIQYLRNKYYKSRISVQKTSESSFTELCVDKIEKLSQKEGQDSLISICDTLRRNIHAYFDKNKDFNYIKELFTKVIYSFGITFDDAGINDKIKMVRLEAGLDDQDLIFKEKRRIIE